jgi:hypothetical protein
MKLFVTLGFVLIVLMSSCFAQADKVKSCMNKIAAGKIDEVKQQLPDLLAAYPQDAGVQMVLAMVVEDPYLSLDKYKYIVKAYPESEWADDAYFRVVETYCLLGDTTKASRSLEDFRIKYPKSEFLALASDMLFTTYRIARNPNYKEVKEKPAASEIVSVKDQPQDNKKLPLKTVQMDSKNDAGTGKSNGAAYGLQVGVYGTQEAAKAEMDKYKKQRLVAEIKPKDVDGTTMYSVVIGNYSSKEAADDAKDILQQSCKCEPIVVKKSK